MTQSRSLLTLSGTWTLDPLVPVLEYWRDELRIAADVVLSPYAQLFQQLLDPASALRRNRNGANIVCLRWEDLLPRGASPANGDGQALAARVDEVAAALAGFEHAVPCLVLCGPSESDVPSAATAALASKLVGIANLTVRDGADALARYRVARAHDAASDRFGHVPYTGEALAAVGTTIARWYGAIVRPPAKVFAVDGDHTLWSGVVGEVGVDGLRVDAGHAALHRALSEQAGAGRLLCLLSKNEEADAHAVFAQRSDMGLRWEDFVAHRADWNPKPDNLRDVAGTLGLGLDSVVFLDDNPVECAQMRAHSPATLTVRVPDDSTRLETFVDHLWLFDRHVVTAEDRNRSVMYRENAARAESRRDAGSLASFLDGLELVVDIEAPAVADLPRLAQLTQRTNQFNASLLRLQESSVLDEGDGVCHRMVRARDRFGDYGLVGQVRAMPADGRLEVDLFMLSCRALGRGIEHRMLAAAGAHAQALGLGEVVVAFTAGERNTPVRRFLEAVSGMQAEGEAFAFRMSTARAVAVAFDASSASPTDDESDTASSKPAAVAESDVDLGAIYERIAHELTTAADIERAIAARSQPRPELAVGFIEPAPGMECGIAAIWRQVLRLDAVGAQDSFRELGGKSIHLVQVHRLLLDRLGINVDITTLFQHPTVASLAAKLSAGRPAAGGVDAARQRGQRVREAQSQAALARRQAIANARTRAGT